MKRYLSIAITIILSGSFLTAAAQSITYLTGMKPVKSLAWTPASEMLHRSSLEQTYTNNLIPLGGVGYSKGFTLRTIYGPTQYGYAEYSLKGRYRTLNFILGTSPFHSASRDKGVFAITADGKKILDKVVESYSVPERISLDVTGVDILRFEIVTGDVSIGIVEPTLWTSSQTPRETGVLTNAKKVPTKLVSELRPYRVDNFHKCVSSKDGDLHEIKISGKSYTSGMELKTNMQLIGNGEAWTYFNLGGQYSTLRFIAGPKDSGGGTLGNAWLTIKSDGKIIYELEIFEGNVARQVSLDIKGCRQLSIESEQADGSSSIALANITVYPEGMEPDETKEETTMLVTGDYKKLPDVCKLISNIKPYAVSGRSDAQKWVYDGKSEHITFSMGGIRFNEGVVLASSSNVLNDNTRASAMFNLEGEFDYVSFTAGWVGKCGVLKNDTLRVYTDTDIALEVPLIATSPNQHYTVPLNKCRRLCFEKRGMNSMSHPAFGIADIVVYRGKPVENNLFTHPVPDLPEEIDLIDLGKPYIHYIVTMSDHQDEIFYDGSTQKRYFQLGSQRINKGFMLQTSTHFDLEAGPLGGAGGGTGAMAGAMGGSMLVGAVGGAAITAAFPFGALIALAAGGTAMESSCAAFNTWGAYDNVTFTVACKSKGVYGDRTEDLMIGADGQVVANLKINTGMEPTTFTIPINRCNQLMFWIQCGDATSGQYIFYDIKLRRGGAQTLEVPNVRNMETRASMTASADPYNFPVTAGEWAAPSKIEFKYCGQKEIDDYLNDCRTAKYNMDKFLDGLVPDYRSEAKYISSLDGNTYRAVSLVSHKGGNYDFLQLIERDKAVIKAAKAHKAVIATLKLSQTNANLSLLNIGFKSVEFGKYIKASAAMMKAYQQRMDDIITAAQSEIELAERLIDNALDIDGTASTGSCILIR